MGGDQVARPRRYRGEKFGGGGGGGLWGWRAGGLARVDSAGGRQANRWWPWRCL